MRIIRLHLFALSALLMFHVLTGCSASTGSLSGKVTFHDTPVVYGTVKVRCPSGIEKNGEIKSDGSYMVPDIPCGPVKIAVISPEPPDPKVIGRRGDRGGDNPAVMPEVDRARWRKLPDEYADPDRSGKETTISGQTQFDIHLP